MKYRWIKSTKSKTGFALTLSRLLLPPYFAVNFSKIFFYLCHLIISIVSHWHVQCPKHTSISCQNVKDAEFCVVIPSVVIANNYQRWECALSVMALCFETELLIALLLNRVFAIDAANLSTWKDFFDRINICVMFRRFFCQGWKCREWVFGWEQCSHLEEPIFSSRDHCCVSVAEVSLADNVQHQSGFQAWVPGRSRSKYVRVGRLLCYNCSNWMRNFEIVILHDSQN